jgi:hypothetical protein
VLVSQDDPITIIVLDGKISFADMTIETIENFLATMMPRGAS